MDKSFWKMLLIIIMILRALVNIAGLICLCILVKWSQGYSNNDIEIIHKFSITLLVIICAYIVAYIIFLCLYERESQRLKI